MLNVSIGRTFNVMKTLIEKLSAIISLNSIL